MKKFAAAALTGLVCLLGAALAGTPEGVWLSEDGGSNVQFANCGGKLCETVVWLNEPGDLKTGKPKTDTRNPDPGKSARPLLGLQVVLGLTANSPNKWSGEIYSAEDGRTYSAHMMPDSKTAKVQGCLFKAACCGSCANRKSGSARIDRGNA